MAVVAVTVETPTIEEAAVMKTPKLNLFFESHLSDSIRSEAPPRRPELHRFRDVSRAISARLGASDA